MKQYTWSTQRDNEIWENTMCDSIEECFGEASDCLGDSNVHELYIGECIPYTQYGIDVDMILEDIANDAYDYLGEVAEDWMVDVTKEQKSELKKELDAVFYEWLTKNSLEPTFYSVENIRHVENPNDR